MSFNDEYQALRKKRKQAEEEVKKGDVIAPLFVNKTAALFANDDIAPVATSKRNSDIAPVKQSDDKKLDFFQKGALEGGITVGNVSKAILGTAGDIGAGVVKGATKLVEGVVDLGLYGVAGVADKAGNASLASSLRKTAQEDTVGDDMKGIDSYLNKYSVLGRTGDAIAEGLGQVGAIILTGGAAGAAGAGAIGTTAATTGLMGVSSVGSGMSEAYAGGATDEEAATYGLIKGAVDAGSELLFGGLGKAVKAVGLSKGISSADDWLAKKLSAKISKQIAKNFVEYGVKASGEGLEEVIAGVGSAMAKQATYMSDAELKELLEDENLLEQFVVGSVTSGIAQSGYIPGMNEGSLKEANKTGRDFVDGLTTNEQKVVDKEYENRIAEQETGGKKLTKREKTELYDKVIDDMEKGRISIDTIEEVLGGDSYKAYKDTVDSEEALRNEYKELSSKDSPTLGDQKRFSELDEIIKGLDDTKRNQLKTKLGEEVFGMVKGDRLIESYNERSRRGQAFEADLTQYDAKQQAVIQKAVDSGILNNTRRTHEFVDMIAKISADKGVLFDFTNNEKLKESGFAVNGKTVNGYVTKDGVTLNIHSSKALNSVVGHEITHVLEGTELYGVLQQTVIEYAKSKGDYQGRYDSLTELYKDIEGANVDAELTADLVGDYLFTDSDFINNLSANNRNVFQKIYDEIKYLAKVATTGSKEARELEKVKRAFEKAYKESGKAQSETKYHISESFAAEIDKALSGELSKSSQVKARDFTPEILVKSGVQDLPMLITQNHVKSTIYSKDEARALGLPTGKNINYHGLGKDLLVRSIDSMDDPAAIYKKDADRYLIITELQNKAGESIIVPVKIDGKGTYNDVYIDENQILSVYGKKNLQSYLENNGFELVYKKRETALNEGVQYSNIGGFSTNNVAESSENVNYSLSDSDGKQLSKEQQEYFKDSKMRDESGNLKVMYHGSKDAGFHVFDAKMSDDDTSFFFVDRNDVAASYSGTSETYEAKTIRTAEDMNKFLAEIGYDQYEAVEKNGKFELLENGDHVAFSDTAQGVYEEFCWYEGVGEGDANYKVYLNLKNPLVVDAEGRNWDNVSAEFYPELYDHFKSSFTAEEKDALVDLAEWEDFSVFKHEIERAVRDAGKPTADESTKLLNSAYWKNADMNSLFSMAADNFSDEVLKAEAVKQMNTRDYAQRAKEQGYDGVIFNNIVDVGGYGNGSEGAATVAIAFDSNQIKSVANEKPTADVDIRYSLSENDTAQKINESMTMQEAKQMIQRAFVLGNIKEWHDGEYKNGDEWLAGEGAEDVAMIIENEYSLQAAYLDKIQGLLNEEFYLTDVLEAYSAGALTGKVKKKAERINIADGVAVADKRFYAPKEIENAKTLYEVANQRITNTNKDEVGKARAAILLYAHNKGAAETLGISDSELNKKLRSWGGYSAKARDISMRINSGVHSANRWTGIESVSWLNRATVSSDEVVRMVKAVEGNGNEHQNNYIARTMLSLDTHIDWSWLTVKFGSYSEVNASQNSNSGRCNGYYRNDGRLIHVKYDAPNTVAHEMGHALDYQWGRDLGYPHTPLTEISVTTDRINGEARVWFDNFKEFADSLVASSDIRSEYSMDIKETFARFVAKFVEWTEQIGTGRTSGYESSHYNDKFTGAQFVQFARLLQEKSAIDAKGLTGNKFSLSDANEQIAPIGSDVYGKDFRVYGKDIALDAPTVAKKETVGEVAVAENATTMFPDDFAPIVDDADQRLASLDDADAPPEIEAPYYESEEVTADDPFDDRDWYEVGNKKVKAYMYENPEVKPFFQEEAQAILGELSSTTKGERWYNDKLYYESGGEAGFFGTKRHTSDTIAEMLDSWGMSYADIEKGLNAIIEDHGAENIAAAKKIEFMLNDRLLNGYKDFLSGDMIPPNEDYIRLLNEKQVKEYSREAFDAFMQNADDYAPVATTEKPSAVESSVLDEDIAPVAHTIENAKSVSIRPKQEKHQRMARATPEEQARAEILVEEPKVDKKKGGALSWIRNNVLDKGMIFEDLSLATGNRELQARWNSIRYANGKAQRLMENGNAATSSLKSIRETVEKSGKTKQFYEYLYHMHNADRMTLAERFEGMENKPVFGYDVTPEMSKNAATELERAYPEFKRYANDVYGYMGYLRELLVDGGVISNDTAKLWAEMYPHYVPIRRVGDEGLNINVPLDTGRTGVNAPIKKATGGNRDILPLFDTMGQRTLQTYKAIAKNRFGVELKNTLGTTISDEAMDIDEAIDGIDAQDGLLQEGKNGKKPTFTVFENGEKVTFEITEEMYDAMKPSNMTYTNKVANTVSNIRRGTLTEYNPWFLLKNAIKDTQDVLINSQHSLRTYAAIPKAIYQMSTNGHWYNEYMDNGGDQNTYFDDETNTFAEKNQAWEIAKTVTGLNAIAKANNVIEKLPRLAEYIASRESGRSIDVAMLDAARVTTNFAAGGDLTKLLNRNGATFLNASVQGAMQQVRNLREAKMNGLRGWASLAGKFIIAGLPAIALNHLLWDDDDEYEELSDYVKENYYIVGKFGDGKFVRIPKGRTVAVIQNAFEQMDNLRTGNDDVDLKSFLDLVVTNLAPNNPLDNNILSPIVDVATNETWYGEDLVPTRLQDVPAAEQYDESTDSISRWLGETFNVSPYKANYLLDQYSGVIGDTFLPMLTPEAESGNDTVAGNLIAPLKDMFTTDHVMNNQNVSDFYEKKDELAVIANGSKATEEDILRNKYINSVSAEMGVLYGKKRDIQNSNLPDAEKYEEVRTIQKQIDSLAREGLDEYPDVSISGAYAIVGDRHYRKNNGEWTKLTDKQLEKQEEVTTGLDISAAEYWSNKEEYDYAYENPEKYAVARSVGGYSAYMNYSSELYDIKADKDKDGKSINGSRKDKVIDWVNNLDADYGTRIILFKSEYPADDTYNDDIIEYLNNRDDLTYEDRVTILKELGFTIENGNVYW